MSEPNYVVLIERGPTSYGAYVPDLPGVIAVGDTVAETQQLIREAIALYLEDAREHGDPIPAPTTVVEYVAAS